MQTFLKRSTYCDNDNVRLKRIQIHVCEVFMMNSLRSLQETLLIIINVKVADLYNNVLLRFHCLFLNTNKVRKL